MSKERSAAITIGGKEYDLVLTTRATNERIPVGQMTQGVTFFKRYIRLMTAE